MNLFKKDDRKNPPSFSKKINPQQENQANSQKPNGSETTEKDEANALKGEQSVQGKNNE